MVGHNSSRTGIIHSPGFFIDENIIITKKKDITFLQILNLIWSDLLKKVLFLSLLISLVVWALLYLFEGSKHEDLKDATLWERLSYTFF